MDEIPAGKIYYFYYVIIQCLIPYVERACCSLPVGEYPAGDLE